MGLIKRSSVTRKKSSNTVPYVLKEGFVDLNLAGHYVCVYILDEFGTYSYIYGLRNIFNDHFITIFSSSSSSVRISDLRLCL